MIFTNALRRSAAQAPRSPASSLLHQHRHLAASPRFYSAGAVNGAGAEYKNILVSQPEPSVTLVTLNRPKALNALSSELFHELNHATGIADEDDKVKAIVITGSEKAL